MLQSLQIKNFALIEQLHIDFSDKLSIITGETGAGKSILLGALGLVLGNRADLTSLKDKTAKCIIEASFKISDYNLNDFFNQNDLDYEATTIIRREILPSGKSRAFVNDSPITLQVLQQLGNHLIDIHSQQQTRELSDEQYQMQIIDAVASTGASIATYKKQLTKLKSLQLDLDTAKQQKADLAKEHDYNTFLLQELIDAKLEAGEQESLEAELEKLSNVEFIKELLAKAIGLATDEQMGALQSLKEIKIALQKLSSLSAEHNSFYDRVSSLLIEMDDVTEEISQNFETLVDDPARLTLINQKLQLLYTLQKKHNVATVAELIAIQNELESKAVQSDGIDATIQKLEDAVTKAKAAIDETALLISDKRKAAIPVLTKKITALLSQLGMPNARFQFNVTHTDNYYITGKDSISLLFSANKGTDFGLLKKVASGGEMSRIMLSVKAVLADYSKLPTIIFDEIDTGVSGEISNKMGNIMKVMSNGMQVFAITHLPQIAAKGNQHYKVFKTTQGETTVSELKLLSGEDRVREIAEMLSGKDISDSALNHARALLN
ncbi:DNA repair protein RecN [Flavobacterium litorale]|uniref:DNA repair protein RecN n=1 Tax=Flavobacterium litorale TaxID=2856519 RepID=A0ABX8V5M5_9FLAO|nr:DNA repair protein RecN [Flavobacterium litorale]QYJ68052.1 DNA repair protein RecN [Flavobacterium litorale]